MEVTPIILRNVYGDNCTSVRRVRAHALRHFLVYGITKGRIKKYSNRLNRQPGSAVWGERIINKMKTYSLVNSYTTGYGFYFKREAQVHQRHYPKMTKSKKQTVGNELNVSTPCYD